MQATPLLLLSLTVNWPIDADEQAILMEKMVVANLNDAPSYGSGQYTYTRVQAPRYLRAEHFEAEVKRQLARELETRKDESPEEISLLREAVPLRAALTLMNDISEIWTIDYAFDGELTMIRRKLENYKSRLEPPDSAAGNAHLALFDPDFNRLHQVTWDGSLFRNYSQINPKDGSMMAIIGTVNDPSLERPPLRSNAPPLKDIAEKVASISQGKDYKGNNAIIVDFVLDASHGSGILRSYYRSDDYVFYMTERTAHQHNETMTHREEYEYRNRDSGRSFVSVYEVSRSVRFDGIDIDQKFDRRRWELRHFNASRPDKKIFSPPLPTATAEIRLYTPDKSVIEVTKYANPEQFVKIIASLNRVDLADAKGVRRAIESVRMAPEANATTGSTRWLVVVNIVVLIGVVCVVLLKVLKMRNKAQ
jgi:hypothetical protein